MREEYDMFVKFGSWDECGSTEFLLLQPPCGNFVTIITMTGSDYGGGVDEVLEVDAKSEEELDKFYDLLKIEEDDERKDKVVFWAKMNNGMFKPLTEEEANLYKDFESYGRNRVRPVTKFGEDTYFLQNYYQPDTLVWEKCK